MTTLLSIPSGWSELSKSCLWRVQKFQNQQELCNLVEMSNQPFWNPWAQKKTAKTRKELSRNVLTNVQVFPEKGVRVFLQSSNLFQSWTSTFRETFKIMCTFGSCQKSQCYQSRQVGQHRACGEIHSIKPKQFKHPRWESAHEEVILMFFFWSLLTPALQVAVLVSSRRLQALLFAPLESLRGTGLQRRACRTHPNAPNKYFSPLEADHFYHCKPFIAASLPSSLEVPSTAPSTQHSNFSSRFSCWSCAPGFGWATLQRVVPHRPIAICGNAKLDLWNVIDG